MCRLYLPHVPESLLPSAGDVIYVDVGVYGHSQLTNFIGRERALKAFEKFTLEHQGYQALYAETLMSYEEFVTMFPREQYDLVCHEKNILKISTFLLGPKKISRYYGCLPRSV